MNISGVNHSDLGRTYRITPIQQPETSAAFHNLYLSRLPLAPPLIIQLDCWDSQGNLIIPYDELPFLVCHLSLETPSGDDATMIQSDGVVEAMLYGTLVAAPTEMTDQAGASGIYFAFPDVSVRYVGEFRIRANVMRITGGQALDSTLTTTFDVVEPSDYVAPPLTDLTKHFDAQGIVKFGLPRSEW